MDIKKLYHFTYHHIIAYPPFRKTGSEYHYPHVNTLEIMLVEENVPEHRTEE